MPIIKHFGFAKTQDSNLHSSAFNVQHLRSTVRSTDESFSTSALPLEYLHLVGLLCIATEAEKEQQHDQTFLRPSFQL